MNLTDIVVIVILAGVMFVAIRYMIRNKKKGKSITGCSGNCSQCPMRDCEKYHDQSEPNQGA